MTDQELSAQKLAELREVAPRWPVLAALLDERDTLARDVSKLAWMNGELALEVGLCRDALGVDEDTDPSHAARAVTGALARVMALAESWRYKGEFGWGAWQEGHGPDETGQALDYAANLIRQAIEADDEKGSAPRRAPHVPQE